VRTTHPAGVTLLESLVALLIVSSMSAIAFANYWTGQQNLELRQAAADIAEAFRQAQSNALGAVQFGSGLSYGYGVHFETATVCLKNPTTTCASDAICGAGDRCGQRYFTFAEKETDVDPTYESSGSSADAVIASYDIPRGVTVSMRSQGCPGSGIVATVADVVYVPPLVGTSIVTETEPGCERLCVFATAGLRSWRIRVLPAGPVEIDQVTDTVSCPAG
jgi:prepilin-type N-terminal cleavage/methylation domain-containing protein